MARLVLAVALGLLVQVSAKKFLQFDPLSKEDVDKSIADELAGKVNQERLAEIEQKLQPIFTSLPKTEYGGLSHQVVRYVLHRFFVQQHGWYVRGLEPNGIAHNPNKPMPVLKDWVAAYTQERFEEKVGVKGATLKDLATLAATLEDLIRTEAFKELEEVYKVMNLSVTVPLPKADAEEAIHAYMMIYLTNRNVSLSSRKETQRKLKIFARKYSGWNDAEAFLQKVEQPHGDLNSQGGVAFSTAANVVADIGERFASFNDGECSDLKQVLRGMTKNSGKMGRIPLHDFYNKSLFTHWKFNERADFLRTLGALDESNPAQPSVIIPNYLTSFSNCLKATSLYAVCCRNECEDLVGHLERQIASPTASPELVAQIVSTMPSDTVPAPRQLSENLLNRLHQMAKANGGEINLHGRLFAQWMHHAFPLECPYPHEAGTTSPQTAAEWMERTGQSAHASQEEMQKVVEDACPADRKDDCDTQEDEPELPWSDAEELLVARVGRAPASGKLRIVCIALALLAGCGWLAAEHLPVVPVRRQQLRKVLLFTGLMALLCAADLLDMGLFLPLAVAILLLGAYHDYSAKAERAFYKEGKEEKCCV